MNTSLCSLPLRYVYNRILLHYASNSVWLDPAPIDLASFLRGFRQPPQEIPGSKVRSRITNPPALPYVQGRPSSVGYGTACDLWGCRSCGARRVKLRNWGSMEGYLRACNRREKDHRKGHPVLRTLVQRSSGYNSSERARPLTLSPELFTCVFGPRSL